MFGQTSGTQEVFVVDTDTVTVTWTGIWFRRNENEKKPVTGSYEM
jgi:hypothetical protein